MCTEGLGEQEPDTLCLPLCALAGVPPLHHRSSVPAWGPKQEPQSTLEQLSMGLEPGAPDVPWLGFVLPAPPSPSPTWGCPAPPRTGASVPHKHQGKPTLLLTDSISALSPRPLYTGTRERDLHPTCI